MNQLCTFVSKFLFPILFSLCLFQNAIAQNTFIEAGLGIGNVIAQEHSLGKGEIHLSLFKSFQFGQLGIDFSNGGNLFPGERSTISGTTETLSPNDTKFGSIMLLYRHAINDRIFLEPRLGYTSLNSFIHADNQNKISQANFSAGLGIGADLQRLTLSLRYQYLGKTANYEGLRDSTTVVSNAETVSLVLLRASYRFHLDKLFGKNKS